MSKFCPLIKEDCKGEQCAFMGDFDKVCMVASGLADLTALSDIPDVLEEINQRLVNIGNHMFVSHD